MTVKAHAMTQVTATCWLCAKHAMGSLRTSSDFKLSMELLPTSGVLLVRAQHQIEPGALDRQTGGK